MGKASRRRHGSERPARSRTEAVPFEARPFAGLPGEADWVALREILPAATGTVTVRAEYAPGGEPVEVVVATVLPLAWPGLHRADGTRLIGTQAGGSSGDASRDLAAQILAVLAASEGTNVPQVPAVTRESPRLQDLLEPGDFRATVHDGFGFWVGDADLEGEAAASLQRANESIVPTVRVGGESATEGTAAFFVRIGERAHIRLVLTDDEAPATDALARLHAAGTDGLGADSKLLGAFRACGLLVPVWDLDPTLEAADHEPELAAWLQRYAAALADETPLTGEERRARNGLLSRQVTLR